MGSGRVLRYRDLLARVDRRVGRARRDGAADVANVGGVRPRDVQQRTRLLRVHCGRQDEVDGARRAVEAHVQVDVERLLDAGAVFEASAVAVHVLAPVPHLDVGDDGKRQRLDVHGRRHVTRAFRAARGYEWDLCRLVASRAPDHPASEELVESDADADARTRPAEGLDARVGVARLRDARGDPTREQPARLLGELLGALDRLVVDQHGRTHAQKAARQTADVRLQRVLGVRRDLALEPRLGHGVDAGRRPEKRVGLLQPRERVTLRVLR